MLSLRIETHASTDTGLVRKMNEDRYFAAEALGLWVVADGMGGMARGDRASSAVVDAMQAIGPAEDFDALVLAAAEAIRAANSVVFAESEASGAQMGTTVVALVIRERQFGVLWSGDSRGYLLRGGLLHQITTDHTQVQELVDTGLLTPEAAAVHPARNVLTRAVGIGEPIDIDFISDTVRESDVFLLCSDGLHGVVPDDEITAFLHEIARGDGVQPMIARCLELGAPDNVTVIAVRASEPTLLRVGAPMEVER